MFGDFSQKEQDHSCSCTNTARLLDRSPTVQCEVDYKERKTGFTQVEVRAATCKPRSRFRRLPSPAYTSTIIDVVEQHSQFKLPQTLLETGHRPSDTSTETFTSDGSSIIVILRGLECPVKGIKKHKRVYRELVNERLRDSENRVERFRVFRLGV